MRNNDRNDRRFFAKRPFEKKYVEKNDSDDRSSSKKRSFSKKTTDGKRPFGKRSFEKKDFGKKNFEKKFTDRAVSEEEQESAEISKKRKKSKSRCPVFSLCGACSHIDVPYDEQLAAKHRTLINLLGKYGKVDAVVGMKDPYHYRCKVNAVLLQKHDGTIEPGNYSEGTHRIVPIEKCYIEDAKADKIIVDTAKLMKSFKMKIYNDRNGYGNIRYIMVRMGKQTGEVMVIIVTRSPIMPSKNNFVKALLKEHPEVTTIVQNINDRTDSMILGKRNVVLYGKGYIEDKLCGKKFRISPNSFYQVNPVQTELLYRKAIEVAGITKKDTVVDAYCGTGTIGIIASDKAGSVIGAELNADAVRDARENAKINDIKNISFVSDDAGDFLERYYEDGHKADVVIMDPPRAGSSEKFLTTLLELEPERISYVSCNPITLERDLAFLTRAKKYKVDSITPFDMFPFTDNIETVCLLSKLH
ncbi:MAG: 23S rRNA (uracil(1939)-C(5))-methyltransferase RlmD [Lachnospiraceae bacterium]|nr:23S rRNA (uracil(1939)-C(5))-methyltransferase RlmD [Lachnospiraceae bacterium]